MVLLESLLFVSSAVLLFPSAVFAVEIAWALKSKAASNPTRTRKSRIAVLVPAHNEASILAETLRSIVPQLRADDQLLVVADNCTDDTAHIGRSSGATVIERQDAERRGKGYALDHGLDYLAKTNPPDVLIIIDADCQVSMSALDILAYEAETENRPVQALYLMQPGDQSTAMQAIASFAWLVKNEARPRGLSHLHLPCQLMGTGMAFPWRVINQAALGTNHVVEDMQLGIDLAMAGYSPKFCAAALVTSRFPTGTRGITTQRTRWEHGHLSTIVSETPRLLLAAMLRGDPSLLAMALDLSVPPLSILGLSLGAMLLLATGWALFGGTAGPLLLVSIAWVLFAGSVAAAWLRFGRRVVSWRELCQVPVYLSRKVPIYIAFLINRQRTWIRTERI